MTKKARVQFTTLLLDISPDDNSHICVVQYNSIIFAGARLEGHLFYWMTTNGVHWFLTCVAHRFNKEGVLWEEMMLSEALVIDFIGFWLFSGFVSYKKVWLVWANAHNKQYKNKSLKKNFVGNRGAKVHWKWISSAIISKNHSSSIWRRWVLSVQYLYSFRKLMKCLLWLLLNIICPLLVKVRTAGYSG